MTDARSGPPLSKTQYVLERLRAEIASGIIDPGASLRQVEIAKRYGVSPTPVREALRMMEAEGSINYSHHHGATIRELSVTDARDLYLLRARVEALATLLAAESITAEQLGVVEAIQEELRTGAGLSSDDKHRLNRQFHLAIFRAGSELVAAHAMTLWSNFPSGETVWSDVAAEQMLMEDHDKLIRALRAHDGLLAERIAANHILHAKALRSVKSEKE